MNQRLSRLFRNIISNFSYVSSHHKDLSLLCFLFISNWMSLLHHIPFIKLVPVWARCIFLSFPWIGTYPHYSTLMSRILFLHFSSISLILRGVNLTTPLRAEAFVPIRTSICWERMKLNCVKYGTQYDLVRWQSVSELYRILPFRGGCLKMTWNFRILNNGFSHFMIHCEEVESVSFYIAIKIFFLVTKTRIAQLTSVKMHSLWVWANNACKSNTTRNF